MPLKLRHTQVRLDSPSDSPNSKAWRCTCELSYGCSTRFTIPSAVSGIFQCGPWGISHSMAWMIAGLWLFTGPSCSVSGHLRQDAQGDSKGPWKDGKTSTSTPGSRSFCQSFTSKMLEEYQMAFPTISLCSRKFLAAMHCWMKVVLEIWSRAEGPFKDAHRF